MLSTDTAMSPFCASMSPPMPTPHIIIAQNENNFVVEDEKEEKLPGHHKYASLPTIPSLPAQTPEHSQISKMVSVSIMQSNHSETLLDELSETEESEEYQSHRKQTFESYDLGNERSPLSFTLNRSKNFSINSNTDFDIAIIKMVSNIKLDDIDEEQRNYISEQNNSEQSDVDDISRWTESTRL